MKKTILLFFLLFGLFSVRASDSISVYIFLSETCPICKSQTLTLRQLYSEYSAKGVSFIGLFPNQEYSTNESIQQFGKKYKLDFELKRDEGQKMVKNFSATTNPQIFVVRKSTQQILYKGKMDNGFENIGKKRQVITEHYLRDALESILQKKEIVVKETQPVGCFIIKTKTP
ncbi:MAG: redoxin domain-containing protein [Bacteroidetes bacterium]|nr:redoxin domain-containing protein [Bacteroidota bacterium]